MKQIVKQDKLSDETEDEQLFLLRERIKELESQIIKIIEG